MTKLHDLRKKSVPLELDGKTYWMRFDLNALALVEERFGDFNEAMNKLSSVSPLTIRYFLFALMNANHEDVTEKEIGSLVGIENIQEVGEKIGEIVNMQSPEQKEDGSKNEIQPPTGDISSTAQEKPESAKKSSSN